jgi:hypothetical protein
MIYIDESMPDAWARLTRKYVTVTRFIILDIINPCEVAVNLTVERTDCAWQVWKVSQIVFMSNKLFDLHTSIVVHRIAL